MLLLLSILREDCKADTDNDQTQMNPETNLVEGNEVLTSEVSSFQHRSKSAGTVRSKSAGIGGNRLKSVKIGRNLNDGLPDGFGLIRTSLVRISLAYW